MVSELNLENDFALIVDHLEPVRLGRKDFSETIKVEAAYRYQGETQEAETSDGVALQSDAIWHLQVAAEAKALQIGDVIIDQHESRWTILELEQLTSLGRWKCMARELRIAYGCSERVDIRRPVWGDNGSGPEIVDWQIICAALPVKIQLDEMILNTSTNPPTKQLFYDIILSEMIDLQSDDRLIAEDGDSYRLQSLRQADRIDVLPIAKTVREEST